MPPAVSVVIPIFRDKTKIGTTIETLVAFFNIEHIVGELVIVNDGGNDGGAAVVEEKMRHYPAITFVNRAVNRGKGYTVREGLQRAQGDFIFYTDADLPYLTDPIKVMLTLLKSGAAELVLANRDLMQAHEEKPGWPRQITHIIYSHFVHWFIPIPFSDTLAGLKGMTKRVAQAIAPKLTIDRFSFDVELLLLATKLGCRIVEVPVSLQNVGRSNLSIRRDAPKMMREILQIWRQNKRGMYDH